MSARSFAKQAYSAFNRDKPRSSITEWVEILTSGNYAEETYDGIPELVDSIHIQATGTAEASRAIRKKLKHGDLHQQYRALVILKALVENGGQKFQTSFADGQLMDALKSMATAPWTDAKVKKKLLYVLASWHTQFKDDPSMSLVAGLYKHCRSESRTGRELDGITLTDADTLERNRREQKKAKKMEEKRKAREAKEAERAKQKQEEERRRRASHENARRKFNFEQEKPQILTTIANASTASSSLVNAIMLVNTEHDSIESNLRVQECLAQAKQSRKLIVRYIQLVENEDMIGTLIESNDRIIAALETYDTLIKANVSEKDVQQVQEDLAAANIHDSEIGRLHEKQRAAVQRSQGRHGDRSAGREGIEAHNRAPRSVHPDLQDLSFGPLGADQRNLPPPIRPSARRSLSEEDTNWRRGSLSDFSDYQSSDEGTHQGPSSAGPTFSRARGYVDVSDNESEPDVQKDPKSALLHKEEDPFADPFAD